MTEFLVILTQAARNKDQSPYLTDEDYTGKMNRVPKTAPLYMWASNDWANFRLCLTKIQGSMLRTDANASVYDITIDNDSDMQGIRDIDGLRSVSLLLNFYMYSRTYDTTGAILFYLTSYCSHILSKL
jgi:hypothetical protein